MKLPCIKYTVYSPHLSSALLLLLEHFTLLHSNLVSSSWLLFSYSCHFFCLQLSSSRQQKHFSSAILMTSHNVTIDKNWSLTFVRFLVCFFVVVVVVFFNLFKCETFFFCESEVIFYFQYFLLFVCLFFSTDIFSCLFVCFFLGGGGHPQGFTKVQVFTTT